MPTQVDYLVVGSGLTGTTIARGLADRGLNVLVLDRRSHVGGNVHDHRHESGIRVHTYGPHYFRTNNDDLWTYVRRFGDFYLYEPCLKSWVDGQHENWPIAASYIKRTIGQTWEPSFKGQGPENFEEASLSIMPRQIYEKFVKGYSEKQWGVTATSLSADLAKRFDVRADDEPRLMRHKYQGIPVGGYSAWMTNMLKGIPVLTGVDYLANRDNFRALKRVIFTGPIDEYFDYRLGKLSYRGQRREHEFIANLRFAQPCGQVNNPDPANGPHIRTLEWKHMMQRHEIEATCGTLLTREVTYTPTDPNAFEYPFPNQENKNLYDAYRDLAAKDKNLLICGRLGEYRYFDMDQAIARALMLIRTLVTK